MDRRPQSSFVASFTEIKSEKEQIQGGDDAPTCSTGNAAFSPGAKLPEEAGCWEAVVVGGVSVDGVLVAHAWIGLLEEELERERESKGV